MGRGSTHKGFVIQLTQHTLQILVDLRELPGQALTLGLQINQAFQRHIQRPQTTDTTRHGLVGIRVGTDGERFGPQER